MIIACRTLPIIIYRVPLSRTKLTYIFIIVSDGMLTSNIIEYSLFRFEV